MKLSVIIPTYQLLDMVYWHIDYHRRRNAPDFPIETIVVDAGSDPYIHDHLKLLEQGNIPDIKVISVENKHDCYSVNAGCRVARGEYVLKLDSDVLVMNKRFWEDLMTSLEFNPNALVGYQLSSLWTKGNGKIFSGFCMAWRRDIGFEWDEDYIGAGCSDMDWSLQFLSRGLPLVQMNKESKPLFHLGGMSSRFFNPTIKTEEEFWKQNKRNHDLYFKKWKEKLPTLKGYL